MFKLEYKGEDYTNTYIKYSKLPQREKNKIINALLEQKINNVKMTEKNALGLCLALVDYTIEKLDIDKNKIISISFITEEEKEKYDFSDDETGAFIDNKIIYSEEVIKMFMHKNIFNLLGENAISHELAHAKQEEDINDNIVNVANYINLLTNIAILETNEKIYDDNYWELYLEVEARNIEYEIIKKFIFEHLIYMDISFAEKVSYAKNIAQECRKNKCINNNMFINKKYEFNDRYDYLIRHIIFWSSEFIRKNPKIILQFPILNVQFNPDGSEKTSEQLLYDYQNKYHGTPVENISNFLMLNCYDYVDENGDLIVDINENVYMNYSRKQRKEGIKKLISR